jgi:predicted membrane-bound spermidine synthase/tetratricopeptide (TPR) repeat protein
MYNSPMIADETNSNKKTAWLFLIILFLFFGSGATGLLYQVVWTRKLALLSGVTAYSLSTTLSIFFLGLGIGSIWGGRLADRTNRPLFLYGVFEFIIGLWAIAFIFAMSGGESVFVAILKSIDSTRSVDILLRALLATIMLIVPVTLMGATLPLLARFVLQSPATRGLRIGSLYSLNTFGAIAGCLLAGFYLIPDFGYTRATWAAAIVNFAIGAIALVLARRVTENTDQPVVEKDTPNVHEEAVSKNTLMLVFAAFAISGFCTLSLEVVWTRLLILIFRGTTYAFTTMLASMLTGIAVGSMVAAWRIDRMKHRVSMFGVIQLLIAGACFAMLYVFPMVPGWLDAAVVDTGSDWSKLAFKKFAYSFSVLLVPTFLLGMSFPFAVTIATTNPERPGRHIGLLYGVNTFGGVIGAIVGGFVLLPELGAHKSVVLVSFVLALTGIVLIMSDSTANVGRKTRRLVVSGALVVGAWFLVPDDVSYLLNKAFIEKAGHKIIHFSEGVEGTVVVSGPKDETHGKDRALWINKMQATATVEKGVKMNRFQAVLPLMFGRELDQALFMCFGSGITAGTLALSGFDQIDAVEISQDVLDAATYFSDDNFDVLKNPRLNRVVDDGRNYLLTTDKKYDLITFEPMPLSQTGVSTFYTREYYQLCKDHLTEQGLVSQWIPLHNGLTVDILRDLVKTYIDVFPVVTCWFVNDDLFLIASTTQQEIDHDFFTQRLKENPALKDSLEKVYLRDEIEFYASHLMDRSGLQEFAREGKIMTDDHPWAEFLAPKLIYENSVPPALEALKVLMRSPIDLLKQPDPTLAADIARRFESHKQDMEGLINRRTGIFSTGEDDFRKSLEIDPNNYTAQYYLTQALYQKGSTFIGWGDNNLAEGMQLLLEARDIAPYRADVHKALGQGYRELEDIPNAVNSYEAYLAAGGTDPEVKKWLESQ